MLQLEPSTRQCRFLLTRADALFAGLTDAHRALEPRPATKTAGWLIGHLSVTGDFGRKLCGLPTMCPREWRAKFNPGTFPSLNADDYPPMSELIATCRRVYTDLADNAAKADAALLAAENPYEPGRAGFPTSGEFVAYMLSGHLGYHVGQLATWREATGSFVRRNST